MICYDILSKLYIIGCLLLSSKVKNCKILKILKQEAESYYILKVVKEKVYKTL